MSLNKFYFLSVLTLALLFQGCDQPYTPSFEARSAEDWNQLFIRQQGWFGGDGIFAIPLDGKEFVPATDQTETLLIFSDTMIGNHSGDSLISGDFSMINNSVALLKGKQPLEENINFSWGNESVQDPKTIFVPHTRDTTTKSYFWLGDGFVNIDGDGTLYLFAYKIVNTDTGMFPFKQVGISLIAIPKGSRPPFTDHVQIETPFTNDSIGSFGSAVYVNTQSAGAPNPDGYIYVYGVKGADKALLVARVKPEDFTNFEKWRYWNDGQWRRDINTATALTDGVSNELSLSPLPSGEVMLTYQQKGIFPEVAIQVGQSPVGPFETMRQVWHTDENDEDKDFFTYNAKAHPHLSPEGAVLISYNVNSFDFWNDILQEPNLYRPRFILLDVSD